MLNSLINLFYPKVCCGCESFLLSNEQVICTNCRHEIPLTHHLTDAKNEAFKKFYGKLPVEFAAAFFYYHKRGVVQEIIHNLKYRGLEEIGTAIGHWCASDLKKWTKCCGVDTIIPVPLHPRKLRERGYNQVNTLGMALAENLEIPFESDLLIRKVYSTTQTRKNLLGRSEVGKSDIFDVVYSEKHHNKHFLVIDDVLTTGSTLEICGRALLKIPGARISIFCIAMSHS